jgi:pantoate--beta-alanine ligase
VIEAAQTDYLRAAGFRPDYFAIRRLDLAEPAGGDNEFAILAAAWLGRARLIDNMALRAGQ